MTAWPDTPTLELEERGGWLTVWFDDAARRNPLTPDRLADLARLAAALPARDDLRAVLFRGRGGTFCSGGDLAMLQRVARGEIARPAIEAASRDTGALLDAIAALPQVTVMAIEGAAMAGGAGLAAAGDIVLAERDARIAFSETRLGLVPAQIMPVVMARIGARETRRLLLLGARLDGAGAQAAGLVDRVVEPGGMDAALADLAAEVAAAAPGAVAATKRLLRDLPALGPEARRDLAARVFADRLLSGEGGAGIAAFFDRRPPPWQDGGDG